jgi:hypothetical protein
MQYYLPERFLQRALATHLSAQGLRVREEVPFGLQRFDAIAFDGSSVLGFEVKNSSWKRALAQLNVYKLCCDQVFIAIPETRLQPALLERCRAASVGLVTISSPPRWRYHVILESPHRRSRNKIHRDNLLKITGFL